MAHERSSRLGGHILVDQLLAHGVDHVFCVSGESYLAVLDGLYDTDIAVTACRQEGGAAKRLDPSKTVICFAGDGCFMMHGQEFATAVQYQLPIIVILIDNGTYSTIRMHQDRHYPGRVSATQLRNPDFAAYAIAFGGHGERVETTEQFAPALQRAISSNKPAILHCLLNPEAITATTTLEKIRQAAQQS